jgi:hypothetical protein
MVGRHGDFVFITKRGFIVPDYDAPRGESKLIAEIG